MGQKRVIHGSEFNMAIHERLAIDRGEACTLENSREMLGWELRELRSRVTKK